MPTLAHHTTDGFGRPAGPHAAQRALLERAVADAPSRIPPPRGWLRTLVARDRSASALIRLYGLWPAIEHAYERVVREFGNVRVAVSAEDSFGTELVMVVFLCDSLEFDRMSDAAEALTDGCYALIAEHNWYRLVISVEPDPEAAPHP